MSCIHISTSQIAYAEFEPRRQDEVISIDHLEKMEEKAEKIRQRFEQRQEARIEELKKKKAYASSSFNQNETPEAFNISLTKEIAVINEKLESLGGTSLGKSEISAKFDDIAEKMQNIQKFITDSVIFLPSYDVRHAQLTLQQLQTKVSERREELLPRRKFSFKPRTKITSDKEPDTSMIRKNNEVTNIDINKSEKVDIMHQLSIEKKLFGFHDQKDSQLIIQSHESKQRDIKLSNLENCVVKIFGCPSALIANNLRCCKILCGPISRPAFVSDCTNSEFSLACQQLRIHTTHNTIFNIHVTGKAIIEDCKGLGFAPFNWEYPNLTKDFLDAGLSLEVNKWDQVDDFNWLKFDEHSPNWYTVVEDKRAFIKET